MPEHFDAFPPAGGPPPATLGDAIAALPQPLPPRDGWPAVRARLTRRRHHRRLGFALAAGIAVVAVLGVMLARLPPPGATNDTTAAPAIADLDDAAALRALLAESAQLEALLAWSGVQWAETGDSVALDQELAERLQHVDLQLARLQQEAPATDAAPHTTDELLLWTERVQLLRQRARLAGAGLLLADGEHSAGDVLLTL